MYASEPRNTKREYERDGCKGGERKKNEKKREAKIPMLGMHYVEEKNSQFPSSPRVLFFSRNKTDFPKILTPSFSSPLRFSPRLEAFMNRIQKYTLLYPPIFYIFIFIFFFIQKSTEHRD